MAILNTGCLASTIEADVSGVTTGYAADCFIILAAAVDAATSNRCVVAPNTGCLNSLHPTQTIPEGQIVFVEDIGIPVIAASGKWIGFDNRVVRRDAPITRQMYSWGCNNFGQLADTSTLRLSPGTITGGGTTWCALSAGSLHAAAIKTDGTLWTWGYNAQGQLGNGNTTSRSSPGTVSGGGTNWCAVSAGRLHTIAIKTDGTLWTWGSNGQGRLGTGDTTNRSSPGTVSGGGTNWCCADAGTSHTIAVKTDGTLWTWGYNLCGQLGDGTTTSRTSPVTVSGGGTTWRIASAGSGHSAAIKTDGTLWTWGGNLSGDLGNGNTTSRSSPGTVSGGGTNWCAISAGNVRTAAIKTDGTLWTWGANSGGQLGDGTTTNRSSPVTVFNGGTTWCAVSAGDFSGCHTVGLKIDGTLWSWGNNAVGQIGDTTIIGRCCPTLVAGSETTCSGGTTWCAASAGSFFTIGLRE